MSNTALEKFSVSWEELGGIDPHLICLDSGGDVGGWYGVKSPGIENVVLHTVSRRHILATKAQEERFLQLGGPPRCICLPDEVSSICCA